MPHRTTVHGFWVDYEQDVYNGIRYLQQDLDYAEAKVFFDQARMHGSAPFEDDRDHQYTLLHKSGSYVLLRRQ